MSNRPRYYRPIRNNDKINRLSWEIYNRKNFFITISLGTLEIQINRWDGK